MRYEASFDISRSSSLQILCSLYTIYHKLYTIYPTILETILVVEFLTVRPQEISGSSIFEWVKLGHGIDERVQWMSPSASPTPAISHITCIFFKYLYTYNLYDII